MTIQVTLLAVKNPYDLRHDTSVLTLEEGTPLIFLASEIVNPAQFAIAINGVVIPREEWPTRILADGDRVATVLMPAGSGGKDILRLVAIMVISFYAPTLAGSILTEGASAGALAATTMGVVMAGSILVNALLPISPIKPTGQDLQKDSQSYGIDGAKNTSTEGIPVPLCYGKFRVAGNVIGRYVVNADTTQLLYTLINAGEGVISGITDIELNDQPITNFQDYELDFRFGTDTQLPIPWFESVINPINKGQTLTAAFLTHTTTDQIERFRMDFVCPGGIFNLNKNTGKRTSNSVEVVVEYRLQGGGAWSSLYNSEEATIYNTRYRTTERRIYDAGGDVISTTPEADGASLPPGYTQDAGLIYDTDGNLAGVTAQRAESTSGIFISGNSTAPLRMSFSSPVLALGTYEIRYKLAVAESVSEYVADTVALADINEILMEKVAYRNTALVALRVRLDDQLNSLPNITYVNHGRVIKVWKAGVWIDEASNNPAWIAWDMLTGPFIGAVDTSRLDLEKWKEWSDYCVLKGLTFDGVFDVDQPIWDALQYVFRAGHAQPINVGTRTSVAIEKETDPTMMFTSSNILEGTFNQDWSEFQDRANEIEVSFYDQDDHYKQRTIKVYDIATPTAARQNTASINLIGITSSARAIEEGVMALKMNRYIRSSLSFEAPIEALACTVGDVVLVQHDQTAWSTGGRLRPGSTTTQLNLDRDFTMEIGQTYKAMVHFPALKRFEGTVSSVVGNLVKLNGFTIGTVVNRLLVGPIDQRVISVVDDTPDGVIVDDATGITAGMTYELYATDAIEIRNVVVDNIGAPQTVTLQSALTAAPGEFFQFAVGKTANVEKEWRVRSIGLATDLTRAVTLIEYNEEIYDWVPEQGSIGAPNAGQALREVPHVTNLTLTESTAVIWDKIRPVVDVSWTPPAGYQFYLGGDLYRRLNGGPWEFIQTVANGQMSYRFEAAKDDTIDVRVVTRSTYNTTAIPSDAPFVTLTTFGDDIAPDVPTGLVTTPVLGGVLVEWVAPADNDISYYEVIRGTTVVFGSAFVIARVSATNYPDMTPDYLPFHYWVRAVDFSGNVGPAVGYQSDTPLQVTGGDLGDGSVDLTQHVIDGSTHGRVLLTALTSNQIDLSKGGVINRTAANITETSTRRWAGETGADVTRDSPQGPNSFREAFQAQSLANWDNAGDGGSLVTSFPLAGITGGYVLQAAGDQLWKVWNKNIPYDPSKLYRISMRVRMTVAPGNPTNDMVYLGVAGVAADGTTLINTTGANTHSSQHYLGVASHDMGAYALNEWKVFTGYFKGHGTPFTNASDPLNPSPLYTGVTYFRPLVILNYAGGSGTMQVDTISVDMIDATDVYPDQDYLLDGITFARVHGTSGHPTIANANCEKSGAKSPVTPHGGWKAIYGADGDFTWETASPIAGNRSLRITGTPGNNKLLFNRGTFAARAGEKYVLRCQGYVSAAGVKGNIGIQFFDANDGGTSAAASDITSLVVSDGMIVGLAAAGTVQGAIYVAYDPTSTSSGYFVSDRFSIQRVVESDNDIIDGVTYGRVANTAVNGSRQVDMTAAGVINRTADNIAETGGKKWAGETGADITANNSDITLKNPSFEAGDKGWTKETGWAINNDASNARRGSYVGAHTGSTDSALVNDIRIPVTQGDRFKASCFVKSGGGANGVAYIRVVYYTAADGLVSVDASSNSVSPTATYTRTKLTTTVPATAAWMRVDVVAGGQTLGTWYADDFAVVKLPADADEIIESSTKKWAGETGANITETRTSYDTARVGTHLAEAIARGARLGRSRNEQNLVANGYLQDRDTTGWWPKNELTFREDSTLTAAEKKADLPGSGYVTTAQAGGLVVVAENQVDDHTEIEPGASYDIAGWVKAYSGVSTFYFGFQCLDAQKRYIGMYHFYGVGGYTTSTAGGGSGTSTITLSPGHGWVYDTSQFIAMNAVADASDIPNFDIYQVTGIAGDVVTISGTFTQSYAGGTGVRLHRSGSTWNYFPVIGGTPQSVFTKYSGTIVPWSSTNRWDSVPDYMLRPGTKYIAPIFLVNYSGAATTAIRAVSLRKLRNADSEIKDGATFGRVRNDAVDGNRRVDMSLSGVINRTADNIAETGSKKWAGETGATDESNRFTPRDSNLLHNADFTEGTAGTATVKFWWTGGVLAENISLAYSGKRYIETVGSPGIYTTLVEARTAAGVTRMWAVRPGDKVFVEAYVHRPSGDASMFLQVNGYDRGGNTSTWGSHAAASSASSWTRIKGTYSVPTDGSIAFVGFNAQINADGTVNTTWRLDHVRMVIKRDLDDDVEDGATYGRVANTAVDGSRQVNMAAAGVINRTADYISETGGKKWAGESGADVTRTSAAVIAGGFVETWEQGSTALTYWENVDDSGGVTISYPANGKRGGKVLRGAGGQLRRMLFKGIPFDPDRLYRFTFRVRMTTAPSDPAKDNIYCGAYFYDANDAFVTNAWFVASSVEIPLNTWTRYVAYLKGTGPFVVPATDPLSPCGVNGSTIAYFRPHFITGYQHGNGTFEVDEISVEIVDATDIYPTLDQMANGSTYVRTLGSRVNAGRPVIDFNEAIHSNRSLDYLPDGATYARPLAARLSSGRPRVDFGTDVLDKGGNVIHERRLLTNLVDPGAWVVGVAGNGSHGGWSGTSGDTVVMEAGPDGRTQPLWKTTATGANGFDGGPTSNYVTTNMGYDPAKSYLYVQFFKITGSQANGTMYHGCGGVKNLSDSSYNGNAYFNTAGISGFVLDRWYASIGIVHGKDYSPTTGTGVSGIYDFETGGLHGAGSEFKAHIDYASVTRSYLYYSTTAVGQIIKWAMPGIYPLEDGKVPNIGTLVKQALLTGITRAGSGIQLGDQRNHVPSANINLIARQSTTAPVVGGRDFIDPGYDYWIQVAAHDIYIGGTTYSIASDYVYGLNAATKYYAYFDSSTYNFSGYAAEVTTSVSTILGNKNRHYFGFAYTKTAGGGSGGSGGAGGNTQPP